MGSFVSSNPLFLIAVRASICGARQVSRSKNLPSGWQFKKNSRPPKIFSPAGSQILPRQVESFKTPTSGSSPPLPPKKKLRLHPKPPLLLDAQTKSSLGVLPKVSLAAQILGVPLSTGPSFSRRCGGEIFATRLRQPCGGEGSEGHERSQSRVLSLFPFFQSALQRV
jgi:hypothetical protein